MTSSSSNNEQLADSWLEANNLNKYGDSLDTVYMGGSPLFNEMTGASTDRMTHLEQKYPSKPWLGGEGEEGLVVADTISSPSELEKADAWLKANNYNDYGDSEDTMYMGGTPLFDETTGEFTERLDYLKKKFPNEPWKWYIPYFLKQGSVWVTNEIKVSCTYLTIQFSFLYTPFYFRLQFAMYILLFVTIFNERQMTFSILTIYWSLINS